MALLSNLGALVVVITEFVLVPVKRQKKVTSTAGTLYRDENGVWEDFHLTEKTLDLVFSSDLELLVETYVVEGNNNNNSTCYYYELLDICCIDH